MKGSPIVTSAPSPTLRGRMVSRSPSGAPADAPADPAPSPGVAVRLHVGGWMGHGGTPCRRRGFSGAVGGRVCGQVPDAARVDNQPCSRDTGGLGGQGWQWGGTPGAGEHSRPSSPAYSLLRLGGSGYEGPSPAPRPSPGQVSHGRAGGGRGPGGPRSRAISLNQEGQ